MKLPYFKFFTGDWLKDTRRLSLAAKGAWIEILVAMWDSSTRGVLSMTLVEYARTIGATAEQAEALINELVNSGMCTRDGSETGGKSIVLISRRMMREGQEMEAKAEAEAERQHAKYLKSKARKTEIHHGETLVTPREFPCDTTVLPQNSPSFHQRFPDVRQMSDSDSEEIHTQAGASAPKSEAWRPPTLPEVLEYARGPHGCTTPEIATAFWNHYEAQGWVTTGGRAIANWKPKLTNWKNNQHNYLRTDSPNKPIGSKHGTSQSQRQASEQAPGTTINRRPPKQTPETPF